LIVNAFWSENLPDNARIVKEASVESEFQT